MTDEGMMQRHENLFGIERLSGGEGESGRIPTADFCYPDRKSAATNSQPLSSEADVPIALKYRISRAGRNTKRAVTYSRPRLNVRKNREDIRTLRKLAKATTLSSDVRRHDKEALEY